jgi:hypothetical protein
LNKAGETSFSKKKDFTSFYKATFCIAAWLNRLGRGGICKLARRRRKRRICRQQDMARLQHRSREDPLALQWAIDPPSATTRDAAPVQLEDYYHTPFLWSCSLTRRPARHLAPRIWVTALSAFVFPPTPPLQSFLHPVILFPLPPRRAHAPSATPASSALLHQHRTPPRGPVPVTIVLHRRLPFPRTEL